MAILMTKVLIKRRDKIQLLNKEFTTKTKELLAGQLLCRARASKDKLITVIIRP